MAVSSSTNRADTPFADITHFRSLIGALQYLAITRPDIQFAVNRVAQHMHQPSEHDYHCLKRILRYIFGTLGRGLLIRPEDLELRGFSDSDWANDKNDRKSTSRFLVFLGTNLISWCTKKQPKVSQSSTETEYRALALLATETMRGEAIAECLSELQSESHENQQKALLTLVSITKVSPQNRNLLAQTKGVVSTLLSLSMSPSSTTIQLLALSVLFNLSLNPNLKQTLADMEKILFLNSVILSSTSAEPSRIAASLLCSLAMLDKNKAKFGVAGTVEALVKVISRPRGPASHHFLSTLAELVQFHGNCTVAVRSGAVPVLIKLVEDSDCQDLAGTSLAILCLLARFEEGLTALKEMDKIVALLIEILKGKCTLSKEGAADILLRLFDESEGCIRDALRLPEFSSVLADLSVRGSVIAREKASLLMKKLMEANMDVVYGDTGNKTAAYLQWI
uniref:U-box domain-containing protein n=1 Tax=Solanum lycopersicum TaxID=4081 RepID=A0A3Q7IKI7_SOLLC